MNDGEKRPRIRLAGVVTRANEILLVEHQRAGNRYYLLPGGGLEWGETCQAGLAREFMEEVSLKVEVGPLLFISESIEPHGERHILNFTFHARIAGGTMKLNPDRRLKDVRWVSRDELMNLKFFPEIRQAILAAWDDGFKSNVEMVNTPWE
jgi:ADP-ribose pyrophosphatase YjhB (NUDIX family)